MSRRWRVPAACAAAYVAITVVFARHLLPVFGGVIAGDEGDPLFVAAILHWNATMVPFTDAWWQLPIFAPTRDTLTFSEHFLGVTPLSTPLYWLTGSPVVTYNAVTLLTFPLCALAMFALARHLTSNAAAAFVAGLVFAFAPYRISQIPHLQMLAFFWAPLTLLGLHAYLDTGRRRWLAIYGTTWMLQCASNSYSMVFLSVLVGFWVMWFVVIRRNWRALAAIAIATLAATVPLAPIVFKYVTVHGLHGFTRDPGEVRGYSADLAAILCAPWNLTLWGWLQTACRPEGQLFPGGSVAALVLASIFRIAWLQGSEVRVWKPAAAVSRGLLVAGVLFAAAAIAVLVGGPWGFSLGPLRVSASSAAKPVMLSTAALVAAVVLSPGIVSAAARSSAAGFYVAAAVLTWLFALGPTVTFMGEPRGFRAPFAVLMELPGVSGLRVPARFWLATTLCLAILVAYLAAALFARRRRPAVAGGVILVSALVLSDGWIPRFPSGPLPPPVPDARLLQRATVLQLPMGFLRDISAEFLAVTGGWRLVNGYSGFFPKYYMALLDAAREEEESTLTPFLARGDLHVVVAEDAPRLRRLVESQPGAAVVASRPGALQYRIPRRATIPSVPPLGERVRIAVMSASCEALVAGRAADGNEQTMWECGPQRPGHELVADLGRAATVTAVVQSFGEYYTNYPRHLIVETSRDGSSWEAAWDGSVRALLITQALEDPAPTVRVTVPFTAREARYVRLRQTAGDQTLAWSIAELEIRGPASALTPSRVTLRPTRRATAGKPH